MSRIADSYFEWVHTPESTTTSMRTDSLLARAACNIVNALSISNTLLLEIQDRDIDDAIEQLNEWRKVRQSLRARFGGVE